MIIHKNKIRIARTEDAEQILEVKSQLHSDLTPETAAAGGFLLETDIDTCRQHIANDYCLVAENRGRIIGFGLVMKDQTVKNSEIWRHRNQVDWEIDLKISRDSKFCYFDQLGFLPSHSREAMKLAYFIVSMAFEKGHNYLIATTVREPIDNRAARPFIFEGTGARAGSVSREYPEIGMVKSDVYIIEAANFAEIVKSHRFYPYLAKNYRRFRAAVHSEPSAKG